MNVAEMNWRDVEAAAQRDPRCVLPIGSTEQHSGLSLCTDVILAQQVAIEAAEPLGLPVFPVIPYGLAPYFEAYPGTISLRMETLCALVRDIIASLRRSGFRRILIVNGHGGNTPIEALGRELMADHPDISIKFHNWWNAPRTMEKAKSIDPSGRHANWMENFPWTRLAHAPAQTGDKPLVDMALLKASGPGEVRRLLEDGSFGGPWQRDDLDMLKLWEVGVDETREALDGPWPDFVGE